MPRIFDNIKQELLPALTETIDISDRADFCVGYFNLRGWREIDEYVQKWAGGDGHCCRLLVGMQRPAQEEMRMLNSLVKPDSQLDNATAKRLIKNLAAEFREQLTFGTPTNADEAGLQRLAQQIKDKKVVIKLFLRHSLHAKLYLLFRPDPISPIVGYMGSSNLTLSGLSKQGELNVDVVEQDACQKLSTWFEDRWNDRWCVDISDELIEIIEESWARPDAIPPYHIYIKIAHHLSQEARDGETGFRIPKDFNNKLLDFQVAAVKIAAHHLNKRNGVMIGDVVGLGKTLMATALARIFEDDYNLETLIICPKSLVPMWEDYREQYRMRAKVLSISRAMNTLPETRRYRLVIIDESHNLRNKQGKKYKAIQEYIMENDSKCILLSATPYNKEYEDLSSQLGLFLDETMDLGIRPEALLREIGETEFNRKYQAPIRSLAAFEKSGEPDDWRDLMRLYLVRRTRSFIREHYAETDPANGRKYVTFSDGSRSYFPDRTPKTVRLGHDAQYDQMFADEVVDAINGLELPRYGLANYLESPPDELPTPKEADIMKDLSRAGKRLMGFCRTNLFKRLESNGPAFLLSLERHILRNMIFLHALENGEPLPIGRTNSSLIDIRPMIEDGDNTMGDVLDENEDENAEVPPQPEKLRTEEDFRNCAAGVYKLYAKSFRKNFRWLGAKHFHKDLQECLINDSRVLLGMLKDFGEWDPDRDAKLDALHTLLTKEHPDKKVLVFTQFADTVEYLQEQLTARGIKNLASVTGDSADPTKTVYQFSPRSNEKKIIGEELRVLLATDVLSEGQNLQDCAIIVNYDLPWAIIRLIQRAGRVDRIGQREQNILCYSFLPADGVERIINVRTRIRQRLNENGEVIGSDEEFFENEDDRVVMDIYNEKAGILDGEDDTEVDLSSYALQIWKNAIKEDPSLEDTINKMPSVVFSSKAYEQKKDDRPEGALVYMRTGQDYDALAWMDRDGKSVTESQFEILRAAECKPDTPALPRHENHHEIVRKAAEHIATESKSVGGQLGGPRSARFKTYERLDNFLPEADDTILVDSQLLRKAIDEIYRYPLRRTATDILNRQLRSGISDLDLANLVIDLREDDNLCIIHEEGEQQDPKIICSLGLIGQQGG